MAKLQPKGSEAVLYKKAPRREVDIVWNSQGLGTATVCKAGKWWSKDSEKAIYIYIYAYIFYIDIVYRYYMYSFFPLGDL